MVSQDIFIFENLLQNYPYPLKITKQSALPLNHWRYGKDLNIEHVSFIKKFILNRIKMVCTNKFVKNKSVVMSLINFAVLGPSFLRILVSRPIDIGL